MYSVSIFVHSIFKNSKTLNALLIRSIIYNRKDMVTWSSFPCVLIIFQELHAEPLERKVNDVNQITIERKTFVGRSITIIIKPFFVLGEREQLSFKTLSTYL